MEYRHLMKYNQHKKFWKHSCENELEYWNKEYSKESREWTLFSSWNTIISEVNTAKILHTATLWYITACKKRSPTAPD